MSNSREPENGETALAGKVRFRTLPVVQPPPPRDGGRLITATGEMAQVLNGQAFRHLVYLEFQPEATRPRGNHYHALKTETLYVINGRLRAVYVDLPKGDRAEYILHAGDLVTISPGCAHVYFAEEYSQAIEVSDTEYDPADTIPFIVEEQRT